MKKVLGLDIGVSSVGLAIISENNGEKQIENMSVRIVPEDPDFHGKFYSGNTASKNEGRTIKRGIRRNNQRFKLRRNKLYNKLSELNIFPDNELFKLEALKLYELRAKAVEEKISLKEFSRVLILLNQRRGFLSNRKANTKEESGTDYKKRIAELESELNGKTIGQQIFLELQNSNSIFDILIRERTYQRASYIEEFDRIWDKQHEFYPEILTGNSNLGDIKGTLYNEIRNKIIYYQRPLKSQKGLISECPFEKHHKAVAKSSPYFEIFRIWQRINDLSWKTPEGVIYTPTLEQKEKLYKSLYYGENLNKSHKLTVSEIKKILGYTSREKIYLNFTELDGSRTYSVIKNALEEAKIDNTEQYLFFNPEMNDEKGGLFELWHITYSLPTEKDIVNTLQKRFNFSFEQASIVAKSANYNADYGSLSTKAIKKLLPYLIKGIGYSEACDSVGYDHSGYKTKIEVKEKLKPLVKNSLRNPVVEQILNQVVNMVNLAIDKYGAFDEIRVELARELRNSAKTRKRISASNSKNKKINEETRKRLTNEYAYNIVNGRDVKRYNLWQETSQQCLYCNNPITDSDFIKGQADIEHILPKSRSFDNSMNNFILAHRKCNADKGQRTAYDFMESKGEDALYQYISKVNTLYKDGSGQISKSKFEKLLTKGEDIPSDFVERMKKDSQYIAKEAVKMLKEVCENVYTTTGQITDLLREEWQLKNALQEINIEKYRALGQTEPKDIKDSQGNNKTIEVIKDWSKRDDHRHHAVDALICALTDQKIIFKLNNLNKIYQYAKNSLSAEEIAKMEQINEHKYDLKEFVAQGAYEFPEPIENLREKVIKHLSEIFISFKKENSKVLTPNINKPKKGKEKLTWVPRARLHEETVMGRVKRIAEKKVKLDKNFNIELLENVISPQQKELIISYLKKFNNNPLKAFDSKQLKKEPLLYKNKSLTEVAIYEYVNTKRVGVEGYFTDKQRKNSAKQKFVENVLKVDSEIGKKLQERLSLHNGDFISAFKNLNENPIYLKNGKKLITVTIYDESKVESISIKKDLFGEEIIDSKGLKIPSNFVNTGGNHHALIYKNEKGEYKDKVISFFDAVGIGLVNIQETETGKPYPIIDRKDDAELGTFQFSMQINDLFVFDLKHSENPQEENEINFFDTTNRALISTKLFRVQKMSKNNVGVFNIMFRHHLEATINRSLKEVTEINFQSNKYLERITKVRINHLGQIVKVGE
ncbi:MAG: type II CRISPR RNA-guided endonuclease Cas9 [Bacteroidales bacterium]|nr:type II CRISPR RNA-guided endonuclease Cas9 [Bacteroidales bacterium]